VSQLLDLGKKWRADSVDVTDGTDENYTYQLKRRLRVRLEETLLIDDQRPRDAVVISYCWD
jgi:hypothetical protein